MFRAPTKFLGGDPGLREKIIGMYLLLAVVNVLVWVWAVVAFHGYPILLGTSFMAYAFGLRHAVDADHVAAIDNVTRKLMQEGRRPVTVGFFFSIGHSTIVFGLSAAVALTAAAVKKHFGGLEEFGTIAGTLVSAIFLAAIAIVNVIVLVSVHRTFKRVEAGQRYDDEDLNLILGKRGFFGRVFRGLFRLVGRSWQMYPIGVLFGLGFDTATEVGLLGISAAEASKGLHVWSIMVFPALFAAGMALVDTIDSVLMLRAYGWAFVKPIRKLYYNMTITAVSVVVALVVGGIETLGLIQGRMSLSGPFWNAIGALNGRFGMLGYIIVGIFVAGWIVSIAFYKMKRYDEIEVDAAK